ncbi:hypothetical protein C0J52_28148, partial [Blattella germanica]
FICKDKNNSYIVKSYIFNNIYWGVIPEFGRSKEPRTVIEMGHYAPHYWCLLLYGEMHVSNTLKQYMINPSRLPGVTSLLRRN